MIIKRLLCNNINELIEELVRTLIDKNISYVVINDGVYAEIHFDNYIYQFYDFTMLRTMVNEIDLKGIIKTVGLNALVSCQQFDSKEKTGYKRYTKKDIKRGNIKIPNYYNKR